MKQIAALERYVRVLPAPDVQQFTFDFARAFERIISHSFPQALPVNIGRIKAGGGEHVRIHGCAKSKMPADADSHYTEAARTRVVPFQKIECRARIGIIGGEFLSDLVGVPGIGARLIVRKHRARGFQFVIDLGHHHDVSMARQKRTRPANGFGDLKNLGKQNKSRESSFFRGLKYEGAHRAGWSRYLNFRFRYCHDVVVREGICFRSLSVACAIS
jgi:hypothetical protein